EVLYSMRYLLLVFSLIVVCRVSGQQTSPNFREVKVPVRDTILLDEAGINPKNFRLLHDQANLPDLFSYRINFKKGEIYVTEDIQENLDSIIIQYHRYPSFLSREYYLLDPGIIVENTGGIDKLYSLEQTTSKQVFTPFEGLNTSGSISRGITVG